MLSGNSSGDRGGGAANGTLNNCVLSDNHASSTGGGSYAGTLKNCSLFSNSSESGGGSANASLLNCIVYDNTASISNNYAGGSLSYSCTTPLPPGEGNILEEPQFVSAWRIASTSPCRGKGNWSYVTGVDMDGEGWLNPPSIGCDECVSGALTGKLSVAIDAAYTDVAVGYPLTFVGQVSGKVSRVEWTFGDGTFASNVARFTQRWHTIGVYPVVLTAFNESWPEGVSTQVFVSVSAPEWYVNVDNVTPIYPYTSWATAATEIQDAIDAAIPGGVVWVTNGVYATGGRSVDGTITNRVVLDKPIMVRSVNGPDVTFIKGEGPIGNSAVRCAYVGNEAVLSGFTLTNGATRAYTSGELENAKGGGVRCAEFGVVSNCVIVGNSASCDGGGSSLGYLHNCVLKNNSAPKRGGGSCHSTLYNCIVSGNSASYAGGGSFGGSLYNCFVSGNNAYQYSGGVGGGCYDCTLYNCTVTGNTALGHHGGGKGGGCYNCPVFNSIVYDNITDDGDENYYFGSMRYSCSTPLPPGLGNIKDDPQFPFPDSVNYHLNAISPCLGKGNAAYVTGVDLDGEAWLNPPSMGCDEYVVGAVALTGTVSTVIEATYTNVSVGYEAQFNGYIQGWASRFEWNFGDGVVETGTLHLSHAWDTPGQYDLVLTAYNEDWPNGLSTTVVVNVSAPEHYVNMGNLTPVYPYASWATAATTIQEGLDATSPGGIVFVTNGVYASGGKSVYVGVSRVALDKKVVVRSVNGPGVTVIKGQGPNGYSAVRCAYVGAEAVLVGFTLTNGATQVSGDSYTLRSGGGAWCESSGVVSNCVIASNSSDDWGGGVYQGRLFNCTVSGNAGGRGGGCYNSTLYNCIVSGNSGWYGAGTLGGSLFNCTVVANSSSWEGGGCASANLVNCIVYDNTAPTGNNYYYHNGNQSLSYCCTTPLPSGIGNITNNPQFVDANASDYRLKITSPCIDKGQNSDWMYTSTDLDGNPRILKGTVDMGAYETPFMAILKVFLQGPYSTSTHSMAMSVRTNLLVWSPYVADSMKVAAIPPNVVDWALLEVRDTNRKSVASASVFLDPLGQILDWRGNPGVQLNISAGDYYLTVRHRNHLAAMTAGPVAFTNTVVSYDFTTSADKYLGGTNACVELEPGVWGLISGDADGDGRITPVDREIVRRQKGMTGYLQGDLNLDGKVDGGDQ
jgi:hypothetical protein